MKLQHKIFLSVSLIFFLFSIGYAQQNEQEKTYGASLDTGEAPKLVVGVVVDQMRYEYIPRFWGKFGDGGFRRLVNKGYNFSNNHFNYVPTYTGPGHAAIYSGATPSVNGIVGNRWYDRSAGKGMYVVSDSTAQTVGAKGNAGQMSPRNLQSTTVTDELKTSRPGSKIIGVSIKDRAAILPAGHVADGAFWYDSESGNFITSSWYADALPQWIDAFNQRNLPEKYSKKVWKPLLPVSEYTESDTDDNAYEGTFKGEEKPIFPHKMDGSLSRIKTSPCGNTLVRQLAEAAIESEQLGSDNETDFLALSFSSTDYVGHRFGPHSIELEDTYLRLDKELAELFSYLDQKIGSDRYLVFLTADHGVVDVPAELQDKGLPGGYFDSRAAFDSLNSYLKGQYGKREWIKSYMNQQVYLNHRLIDKEGISRKIIQQKAAEFLRQFPGVSATKTGYDLGSIEYSEGAGKMVQNGYYAKRSGDVYIQLKPGWLDSSHRTGTSHGSPYSYDTHVPLLFYGWKIPHGRTARKTAITQIAPTISAMLNITFPSGSADHPLVFE